MKKILLILIFACAVLSACGNDDFTQESETISSDTNTTEPDNENIESLNEMQFDLSDYGCSVSYSIQHHIDKDINYMTIICSADSAEVASDAAAFLYTLVEEFGDMKYTFMVYFNDLYIWYIPSNDTYMISSVNKDGTAVLGTPYWFDAPIDSEFLDALSDTYKQYQNYLKGEMDGQNN